MERRLRHAPVVQDDRVPAMGREHPRDLVVGSEIEFADRGTPALKGVPGEWRLFEARV